MGRDAANVASGFYGSLKPGRKPALLVIDYQLGFTDISVSPLASDCARSVEATARLIAAARPSAPVIFTAVGYDTPMLEAGVWREKCGSLETLMRGSKAVEIDPRLGFDPACDTLLVKAQASAFFGTPLASLLAAGGYDTLLVAGCTTSGCVRASVVDAIQYGFRPFVVRECVADRSPEQHESNLVDMQSKYSEVIDLADAIGMIEQAGFPGETI
ncbi:isochorismatase family protein [Pseudaminobacter arsenicus]|uniref:Isochorismatase family protein n=1 Tax=Borborobacter arsenicus TaxID=1851146 RepID=A0A432UYY2_9HYPH|nr:isochorismatase family protein [Pseudaminobacter arsenicus]RUM95147.1 isochorismatase family protein [Pseudaminobacter arsenicus]